HATVIGTSAATSGSVDVGQTLTGALTISGGGTLSASGPVQLGVNTGASGMVAVTGAGSSLTESGTLVVVGQNGTGSLFVSNGGAVSSTGASVGDLAGSNGTLTVTGAGSTLTSTGVGNQVIIGNSGTGSLQIASGGVVNDAFGFIGNNIGGAGSATVNGLGSQ